MGVVFFPELSIEQLTNFRHLSPSRKAPLLGSILLEEIHPAHGQRRETAVPLS